MAYTPGKGATISIAGSALAQVVNITPPAMNNDSVEVTHLTSTWGEYLQTIPDGGEVTFTLRYDSGAATHSTLWTNFKTPPNPLTAFVITITNVASTATTISFSAAITNLGWAQVDVKGVVDQECTLKVSGAVTIA